MSTVLRFRSSTRGEGERPLPLTPCEIVIFPGVRIERHETPETSLSEGIIADAHPLESSAPVLRAK